MRFIEDPSGIESITESDSMLTGTINYNDAAAQLAQFGRRFHARGWVLGTSGNFSAVIDRSPLQLAITSSGVDKGNLGPEQILQIDDAGRVLNGSGRPSDETLLHLTIIRERAAAAVLHTHSIWSTILSQRAFAHGGIGIEGYEMLKGLAGVRTHEHREWIPILDNSQDMVALARDLELTLRDNPDIHAVMFRGHGLYTWGSSLAEAGRHIEILEFLLEVYGRTHIATNIGD